MYLCIHIYNVFQEQLENKRCGVGKQGKRGVGEHGKRGVGEHGKRDTLFQLFPEEPLPPAAGKQPGAVYYFHFPTNHAQW